MIKEIKRNSWSRFVKKFSTDNRYRRMAINTKNDTEATADVVPFFGLELEKKGRLIDGFKVYTHQHNPDNIPHPVISVKDPELVKLEKDNEGNDTRLLVKTKDGQEAEIKLDGSKEEARPRNFVEKVAYTLYEKRGCDHGQDHSDWITAESLVTEAEEKFIR